MTWVRGASASGPGRYPVNEFGLAGVVGMGWAVLVLSRTLVGPTFVGPMLVAAILGAWGTAQAIGASSILACTLTGIVVSNLRHETACAAEAYLRPFGGVLFAGFYTLAGMRLDFGLVLPLAGLVALYFAARLVSKVVSSYVAMSLAGVTDAVRRSTWAWPCCPTEGWRSVSSSSWETTRG